MDVITRLEEIADFFKVRRLTDNALPDSVPR